MRKFSLEIVVFFCGAILMAFQIIGSRMLGPYVGTSMFVWTSIISVILLSLSVGYFWGGRLADLKPRADYLALVILMAALFLLFTTFIKIRVLEFLMEKIDNVKFVAILASLLLFTIPSIMLGMVSPFAARIKVKTIEKSGATIGNLYALSTLGSICGVFLAGFYLIPTFKITTLLFFMALLLIILSTYLNLVYRFYFIKRF